MQVSHKEIRVGDVVCDANGEPFAKVTGFVYNRARDTKVTTVDLNGLPYLPLANRSAWNVQR